jgi:hypothetical protein
MIKGLRFNIGGIHLDLKKIFFFIKKPIRLHIKTLSSFTWKEKDEKRKLKRTDRAIQVQYLNILLEVKHSLVLPSLFCRSNGSPQNTG